MDEDDREDPRPSCHCRTTHCLRGYCPCFSGRWYCSAACRCEPCANTEAREALVEERAEMALGKGRPGAAAASKACTCRKSECKKNYCNCFKNRVACTGRCKCEGCANPHGAKEEGAAVLPHSNGGSGGASTSGGDSNVTPDGGSGTPPGGGSDGTSDETAVITDERGSSVSPTEAELQGNLAVFLEPSSDTGQHVHAPSFAPFNPLDCFTQDVHSLLYQGSVQAFLDPSVNSGSQEGLPGEIDLYEQVLFSWH